MRLLKFLIFLLILAGGWLAFQNLRTDVGTLQVYSGSASIVRANQTIAGTIGASVKKQDTITTGQDSRVAIVLRDNSVIRLQGGSQIKLADLNFVGDHVQSADIQLESGRLWSRVEPLSAGATFQVETPTAVASVRGTKFGVDALPGQSRIFVRDSHVAAALKKNRSAEKVLDPDQLLDLRDASADADFRQGPRAADAAFLSDSWITFNDSEDAKLDQSATRTASQTAVERVTKVEVSADETALTVGESTPVHVMVTFDTGATRDVTDQITWQQSNAVGTFAGGRFTATRPGTTSVSVTVNNVTSNEVTMTVR